MVVVGLLTERHDRIRVWRMKITTTAVRIEVVQAGSLRMDRAKLAVRAVVDRLRSLGCRTRRRVGSLVWRHTDIEDAGSTSPRLLPGDGQIRPLRRHGFVSSVCELRAKLFVQLATLLPLLLSQLCHSSASLCSPDAGHRVQQTTPVTRRACNSQLLTAADVLQPQVTTCGHASGFPTASAL